MDYQLGGLRVLITAGASGIGLATARAFVGEGAHVYVTDVDREALDRLAQSDSTLLRGICDVADRKSVAAMFEAVIRSLGGLDVLVNNAGIAGPTAKCEEVAPEDWERTLAVNITGQFNCTRLAIPHLRRSGNASIVNLSSAAGRFGFPLRTPYSASKWAVIGFTKSLSIELGGDGIRVNAICPGSVAGPRIEAVYGAKAKARGVDYSVVLEEALAKTSLRRLVTADDIANTILFLCSPAGANISGQALAVDADAQALV
jgi:NAD(P)-dependent dehydrogenase (short-subunit alcohol dehydrogenase family)